MTKQLSTDEIVAQAMRRQAQTVAQALSGAMLDSGELPQFKPAAPTTHEVVLVAVDGAVTCWLPGTFTPAHDGEYEVLHPVTGRIFRAEYDTVFEEWSCDYQYPTWRGCTEQVP